MADTHSPTLVSKSNEVNSATNPIFEAISDGVDTLAVNADGSLNATVTATDLDIRDLTHVSDSIKVGDGTDFVAVNADGSLNITDNAGSLTVDATNLDIRDLTLAQDAVQVSANTTANSAVNPIFVSFTQAPITGEVHDYDTAAAVAAGASSNHDYTVTTAFLLKSVKFANSGAVKVEVQAGPVASLVTYAVGFLPLAGGTGEITFDPPIEVPTTGTGTVRVIRTNRNFVAVDVYSTIVGIDA